LHVSGTSVRVSFQLGPWRSPRSKGWQEAYDALVAGLHDAGASIYGVLEAGLAGGKVGSASWRHRFAANAADVVARYADRIPAFEALPGPNQPALDGSPRVPAAAFGRVLAEVYRSVKDLEQGRKIELVAGAIAQYDDGPAYLARVIEAGMKSAAWEAARGASRTGRPFDAVAAWLDLPSDPGAIPAGRLDAQIAALLHALSPLDTAGSLPVYVSGLTRQVRGQGDFGGAEIGAALADLRRSQPQVRIAASEAAASGPSFATPEEIGPAISLTFAVFSVPDLTAAFEIPAEVPTVDGFEFPVGRRDVADPGQAGYAMTTSLADPGYYAKYNNAWHPGEDWAAFGGCDASLGEPVYAIADGLVVSRDYFTPSWGRIILIRHTLRNGTTVWSQYAHLDSSLVEENAVVRRGQQIGAIGKGANNAFCAHLHFEIRNGDLKPDTWFPLVRDKARVLANYLSPAAFISAHRPTAFPDYRGIIVDNEPRQQEAGTFTRAETPDHWVRSYFGWNDTADVTYASTVETDWGEWRPRLPAAGRYEAQAWIPSRHATTRNAVYTIHHVGGLTARPVDQAALNDEWISLGTYDFGLEGALVRLTDKTGEADSARLEVCFDAVRWLPA
jgi:murein DD-endopeptidase MepM/ murein hydrolase activator NlpD